MGETEDAADAEDVDPKEDELKMSLQFKQSRLLTTHSTSGTKLLRCCWDQSALLQAEWNVPLLGRYENKDIGLWINSNEKEGVVLMQPERTKAAQHKGLGMLLPLTKEFAFLNARKPEASLCDEAYDFLVDERSEDVSFTIFDWIGRNSSTATKMLVQTGKYEVSRTSKARIPLTPIPKEAIRVFVEFAIVEFLSPGMPEKWREVRADAASFLKFALEDLVPSDMIIEHAKKVNWGYWDSDWECVNATSVLTKRGFDIFSKRAIERGLLPGLFLGHGPK